jgi:phosphogluconate dehydratase
VETAHGFAACQPDDKASLKSMLRNNIAIITSYNDMLSAHQPYDPIPISSAKRCTRECGRPGGRRRSGHVRRVTQGQDGWNFHCSAVK